MQVASASAVYIKANRLRHRAVQRASRVFFSSVIALQLISVRSYGETSVAPPPVTYEILMSFEGTGGRLVPGMRSIFSLKDMTYTVGDLQSRLRDCADAPGYFCVATSGFQFAVPKAKPHGQKSWTVNRITYRVERAIGPLALLGIGMGRSMTIVASDDRCENASARFCKTQHRFLFAEDRGVVAIVTSAEIEGVLTAQIEMLIDHCGLAAPRACYSASGRR